MTPASQSSVRVAVRVRPMTRQESDHHQECKEVIDFIPNEPQIVVGQKQSFTFDHVYPPLTEQAKVYETCVIPLVHNFLEGYNATVLAYGQTGAGKSFSMGIGLDSFVQKSNEGIVPRFIDTLFDQLAQKYGQSNNYQINVSFLELHNEDLIDLLSPGVQTLRKENQPMVVIREDSSGAICWSGIREERVTSPQQLLCLLEKGSVARTTAATDMNISSSRSHAIFSIQLRQTPILVEGVQQGKAITSKFHFVDLAGSERLKRTNAVGHRAKEGISINSGLLALGNVISALGDESRRSSHIPYRDSKLTRLLQDSLGGNSQTLMLACVSPAWSNLKETLNTLKYANRARNIRNRVAINQEVDHPQGEQVKKLKSVISQLRQEIQGNDEFMHAVNNEMDGLKTQVEALKSTISSLVQELAQAKHHSDSDPPAVQDYAYVIEELKMQIILLQQEKHQQQKQMVVQKPPTPPPEPIQNKPAPMMSRTGSKHSQFGKDSSLNRKKKRHSFRVGSKKLQRSFSSIRKRQSQTILVASPPPPLPPRTTVPQHVASGNKDEWKRLIHQHVADLNNELGYVDSKKAEILGNPNWSSDLIKKSFKDLMNFSSSFPLENTLHVSESTNYMAPHYGHSSTSSDLTRILQRFGESLDRQYKFIHSLQSVMPVSGPTTTSSQDYAKQEAALCKQHKRELNDLKRQTDQDMKKQQHEHQALKRHYQQLVISTERARTQHNATVLSLKQKVDTLTRDKKKLVKKSKQDADRARDRGRQLEKQVNKLERQETKSNHVKKRLERDLHAQKQVTKHTKEDLATLVGQLSSVAMMVQKVLNNKKLGSSDRSLLAKAVACARVRGYLVAQKHGGNSRRGVASLQHRMLQKKQLIHRAIELYVQAYLPMQVHEQKCELTSDCQPPPSPLPQQKHIIITNQQKHYTNSDHDDNSSTTSDDTWMDDAPFWTTEDAQVAYENILILVRTLEPEETRSILETMVHHVIQLETDKHQKHHVPGTMIHQRYSLPPLKRQQDLSPVITPPTSTANSTDIIPTRSPVTPLTSNTVNSTPIIVPRPSVSAAIRKSGLPTPRRSSCK
ncbi:P-loop containing nucleoside triphosphate hydrolase protein [Chlamydoabsidia padenii]|nr:P-loop containing nucleoside triphosphate hydrolase protein [Chlamydoabsidia padenii]